MESQLPQACIGSDLDPTLPETPFNLMFGRIGSNQHHITIQPLISINPNSQMQIEPFSLRNRSPSTQNPKLATTLKRKNVRHDLKSQPMHKGTLPIAS